LTHSHQAESNPIRFTGSTGGGEKTYIYIYIVIQQNFIQLMDILHIDTYIEGLLVMWLYT